MWKLAMQLLAVLSLICIIAGTPAMKPQSIRGIIYPTDDIYDNCFVDEQRTVKGSCKKLSECPRAVERWRDEKIRPQTCYFNKFDHIVCCEPEQGPTVEPTVYIPPMTVNRRSEKACEKYYALFRTAVVHGQPTRYGEFPYMVALGWKPSIGNTILYRCGGVLISERFALTAAHCAEFGGDLPVVVHIGGTNLTDRGIPDVNIKSVVVHPGYDVSSSYNDIALVELETPVGPTPACIWSEESLDHNNVTAIGYGHTRFAGSSSDQLLKAPLFVVTNEICKTYFEPDPNMLQMGIASTHICAGDPERLRDTCQGDSGGPIIMQVERDFRAPYVVGITSFGQGCAGEPPSIYTRTSAYINWIEDIVWPVGEVSNRQTTTRNPFLNGQSSKTNTVFELFSEKPANNPFLSN